MLEAKHSVSAHINPSYQALLAFKPRQVVLAEQFKRPTTMKHFGGKTQTLNPDQKPLLIHSVLRYLECNGFSRALKRLLSEAQIESDSWKSCSVNLEDVYRKYLETSTCAEQNMSTFKEQDGDKHCPSVEQKLGKKKRGHESESHAGANQSGTADRVGDSAKNSGEILTTDLLADLKVELKGKKESKKVSDSLIQISDTIYDMQIDESAEKQKDRKKKKSKSVSESVDDDVGKVKLGSLPSVNEEKCNNLKPSLGDTKVESEVDVQSKDKKKKNKPSSNTDELGGNVEKQSLLSVTATEDKSKDFISSIGDSNIENEAEGKSKDKKKKKKKKKSTDSVVENVQHCGPPLENIHAIPVEEKLVESKDKKKKKKVSVSEPFSGVAAEVPNKEDPTKGELKKESLKISEDTIDEEKKSSKKRKILASDENDGQSVEKLPTQQSKRRKTERLEDTKGSEQLTGDNEDGGKESKGEHGPVGETEFQNTSIKQLEVHANGNVGKHLEKSAVQKTRREKCNGSAEPKTVNAFQRVKIDEVKFADERLQDNSYWAKSGADSGYGAKAQEILGQVRGRDFRHEKTKKKRGSYRGGQIDQETHSIKFHYSDDE